MSEMLKFIFSVFLAQRQKKLNPKAVVFYWRRYMLWGIPSLIYFIQVCYTFTVSIVTFLPIIRIMPPTCRLGT